MRLVELFCLRELFCLLGDPVLLPDSVEPIAYSLTLTPDLKAFTFDGVVDIDIAVTMSGTSTIELHARDLYIIPGKTTYTPAGGNSITAIGHSLTYSRQ